MRKIIIGAIALALGCATTGQQEQKSQALSAQDQAHQSLQAAADAQKRAVDEQKKAEAAQKDVEDAQRALADAQAKLSGPRAQAQQDAQQKQALNQDRTQSWTQEQTLSGRVVRRSGDQLRVRTDDQGLMNLD